MCRWSSACSRCCSANQSVHGDIQWVSSHGLLRSGRRKAQNACSRVSGFNHVCCNVHNDSQLPAQPRGPGSRKDRLAGCRNGRGVTNKGSYRMVHPLAPMVQAKLADSRTAFSYLRVQCRPHGPLQPNHVIGSLIQRTCKLSVGAAATTTPKTSSPTGPGCSMDAWQNGMAHAKVNDNDPVPQSDSHDRLSIHGLGGAITASQHGVIAKSEGRPAAVCA